MDWKRLKNVLLVTALIFAIQLPTLAAKKQEELIEMPKNYPDKYTSQYVHLSRYADGLYVGKPVTINDALGQMGTTGNSTGVHLHLAVLDCALFDPNDNNCRDLGAWYRYDKIRFQQGYIGLGTMMNVPGEWYSR